MGIYNCADTLLEAIESLLSQTYQDFKVIMCDDASSDNTYEIASQYVERYPGRFILLRNKNNLTLAPTLNRCLEFVDTEYVARMDGDDLCDPTRFEKQIRFLDSHPEFSHVSSAMKYFDESGFYGETKPLNPIPRNNDFKKGSPYCHAPTMFRKSALDSIGGYTDEARVERIEDYYLWYKMHKAGLQGFNLEEPLYWMRNDRKAFSRRKLKDRYRAFKIEKEVLSGLDIDFGSLYALKDLSKGLIPSSVIRWIKKHNS